jgi:hypothetical protein
VARVFGTGTVWKGGPQRVTAPYGKPAHASSSRAGHEPSCLNMGGPPSKPKYSSVTDSEPVQYREGKVKSTAMSGVKQFLKPDAYKQSEVQWSEIRNQNRWQKRHRTPARRKPGSGGSDY